MTFRSKNCSGSVRPSYEGTLIQIVKTVLPMCYDMEMVIALAFRLRSPAAEQIRRYVMQNVVAYVIGKPTPMMLVRCGERTIVH